MSPDPKPAFVLVNQEIRAIGTEQRAGAHQAEIGVFLIQGKLRCEDIEDTNLWRIRRLSQSFGPWAAYQMLPLLGLKGEHSFSA